MVYVTVEQTRHAQWSTEGGGGGRGGAGGGQGGGAVTPGRRTQAGADTG